MAGMFGKLGSALTKRGDSGLSLADRIAIFGSAMSGDYRTALALREAPARRAEEGEQKAWREQMSGMFGAQGPQLKSPPIVNQGGDDISAAFAPRSEMAQRSGIPSMQDALPVLLRGAMSGDPAANEVASLLRSAQPDKGQFIEGPDGIYERGAEGWTLSKPYPNKGATVSPGWELGPDGKSWQPIKNGPYDPDYIARTTGVRRDAVVSRPMPRAPSRGKAPNPNAIKWD
jgi:hypothetical protein